MSQLDQAQVRINSAIRALERARSECDLNERLRCLHNARYLVKEAWDLTVEWRGGESPPDLLDGGANG